MTDFKETVHATYTIDDNVFEYRTPTYLADLGRYNVAMCARKRMLAALEFVDDHDRAYERWKRERISFWSTLARSIPHSFR